MTLSIRKERLGNLLRDMINRYSPSGKEEELASFLADYLADAGLHVRQQAVDGNRCNLLVSAGKINQKPETLFLGHMDTVTAFDIEDYGFARRAGVCYGLGAADMKSGCAALIEAFMTTAEAGCLPERALLALVVGEEETGDGTQALLETFSFPQALVAEPTNLEPCLDHYGYVEMVVRVFGYRRHAAMSSRDTNATRALLRLLLQLEDRVERHEPDTVLNIRDLHSSESGFAVPDRCAASVDLHVPPAVHAIPYADKIRRFVEDSLSGSNVSGYEIDFPTLANGYCINPQDSFVRRLQEVFSSQGRRWTPNAFTSHSDANLLRDAGCRPIILGPGQLAKAHTQDESVDFAQVICAAELYAELLLY